MNLKERKSVRFPTTMISPRALAGSFDLRALKMQNRNGVSLQRAVVHLNHTGVQSRSSAIRKADMRCRASL